MSSLLKLAFLGGAGYLAYQAYEGKQPIPSTPLQPGKATEPLTGLTPAKKTQPLSGLTPSKKNQPLTGLTPAAPPSCIAVSSSKGGKPNILNPCPPWNGLWKAITQPTQAECQKAVGDPTGLKVSAKGDHCEAVPAQSWFYLVYPGL